MAQGVIAAFDGVNYNCDDWLETLKGRDLAWTTPVLLLHNTALIIPWCIVA